MVPSKFGRVIINSCIQSAISFMNSSNGSTPRIESERGGILMLLLPFDVTGVLMVFNDRVGERRGFFEVSGCGEGVRRRRRESKASCCSFALLV